MNTNLLITDNWSNPESEDRYLSNWKGEPEIQTKRESGEECRKCSFWAKFNEEWGLCCNSQSRHHLETVFERFTCPSYVDEGLGPHSFSSNAAAHCVCGGRGEKYLNRLSTMMDTIDTGTDGLEMPETVDWPEGLFDAGDE